MQRLKEVGFIRPRKYEEQLNASKCKANQIPNEDCVADQESNNEYWVRSQNKDTHDTWYKVIHKISNLHFCNCNWALNGNVCKHAFKLEMLVSNTMLGDGVLPNVFGSTIEKPKFLVDLNKTVELRLGIQIELPPCFNYPSKINSHNETNINDVENLSCHVYSTTLRPNSASFEDDEMKFVISSTRQELRGLLSTTPTNLEQAYALKNLVANAHQEYNKMFFSTITPSNITTKRHHSFFIPFNKKRQHGCELKSRKDIPQFQRVG